MSKKRKPVIYIYDPETKENLNTTEIGLKLGKSRAVIYSWIRDGKCNTMQDLIDKRDKLLIAKTGGEIFDTYLGKLKIKEIIELARSNRPRTQSRMRVYGIGSPAVFFPKVYKTKFKKLCIEFGLKVKIESGGKLNIPNNRSTRQQEINRKNLKPLGSWEQQQLNKGK